MRERETIESEKRDREKRERERDREETVYCDNRRSSGIHLKPTRKVDATARSVLDAPHLFQRQIRLAEPAHLATLYSMRACVQLGTGSDSLFRLVDLVGPKSSSLASPFEAIIAHSPKLAMIDGKNQLTVSCSTTCMHTCIYMHMRVYLRVRVCSLACLFARDF